MKAFFDSNIFLYHLTGKYPIASEYIEKVEIGTIHGYINDIVYSEVILGFLRAETELSSRKIREKLPALSIDTDNLRDLFSLFTNLSSQSGNDIFHIMDRYHLMPHDALITGSCKQYGLDKIVTNDTDFTRVDFLEIINPPIKEM
ncbi:MAG: PIN domain-containing protein [Methanospirillaceae archaeon]|nr:PIN domain-containing protein [Methanospirillaceae archaeon]